MPLHELAGRGLGKGEHRMLWLLLIMLASLVLAGVVVVYVAFPHRGEDVPGAPWLGDAMRKGVDALPTIDNQRGEPVSSHRL